MDLWLIWMLAALLLFLVEIFTPGFAAACLSIGCLFSCVLAAIAPEYDTLPVLEQVDKLSALANTEIPRAIEEIRTAPVLHTTECDVDQMPETVRAFLK